MGGISNLAEVLCCDGQVSGERVADCRGVGEEEGYICGEYLSVGIFYLAGELGCRNVYSGVQFW